VVEWSGAAREVQIPSWPPPRETEMRRSSEIPGWQMEKAIIYIQPETFLLGHRGVHRQPRRPSNEMVP
jgi:hypothetical protein